jgi:anti-anti-sigma factor
LPGRSAWATVFAEIFPGRENKNKETTVKLDLRTRRDGEVSRIHCAGRIVCGEEASAFSRVVGRTLQHSRAVVLELDEVRAMDGAGLGALVLLHLRAVSQRKALILVRESAWVRKLLELTKLSSVLEIDSGVEAAVGDGISLSAPATCPNAEFRGWMPS